MTSHQAPAGYAELNAVLERVARADGPVEVSEAQLLGLQYRWTTALSARLDQAIEFADERPLVDAVARAWRRLATEQSSLRAVLDRGEAGSTTTLRAATDREMQMLAVAAGLTGLGARRDEAVRLGRAYRELIRSGEASSARQLVEVG